MIDLVESLLGLYGVGADDDFFALGGDSLVTMRLVEAIRRQHGVELPPSAVFGGMTPARLARYFPAAPGATAMPQAPGDSLPSCLVPLRATGDDRPLFFVHPAAGVVFPYFELARAMPASRPFWALQAVGLDGDVEPDADVESMARRYVAAIRQVQPRGPYLLGAYSFGCYVAFEMALQLERAGETVATIALVDEAAPLDGHRPTLAMMSRIIFGRAGRTLAHHLHDYLFLRDRVRRIRRGGRSLPALIGDRGDRVLERLLRRSAMAALLPEHAHGVALDQPAMAPLFTLLRLHLQQTLNYTPRSTSACGAVLFRSSWVDDRPRWMRVDSDPTYGWHKLCGGGVDICAIPGDHLAVIRRPHVLRLATELEAALSRCEPQPRATPQAEPRRRTNAARDRGLPD